MTGRARVMLFVQAPEAERATLEELYRQVSGVLKGTPGLVRNELLHSRTRPAEFIVLSEWESLDAFQTWEQGPVHRGTLLESLRRYTTGAAFFDVLAAY